MKNMLLSLELDKDTALFDGRDKQLRPSLGHIQRKQKAFHVDKLL